MPRCMKAVMRTLLGTLFLLSAGCGEPQQPEQAAAPPPASKPAPYLLIVTPRGTTEKTAFNTQPDGVSAFSVTGKGFDPHAVITANGQKLTTIFGDSGWLTSAMPGELYEKAGVVTIKVVNSNGKESNSFDFNVTAAK
jgi:hypothetical protein